MNAQEDAAESAVDQQLPTLVALERGDNSVSTLGGFDRAGVLRAAGFLHLWPDTNAVVIHGLVDPSWSGRGIGGSLMAWQEGRGRQILAALPGDGTARLVAYVAESAANRRRLLMAAGFSPLRSIYRMRRDLEAPIPCHNLPEGLRWRSLERFDPESIRLTHNAATGGGWAPGPIFPELWHRSWQDFRPELSCIAYDPAAELPAGYVLALIERLSSKMAPRSQATIQGLAVTPGYRERGIGRALLTRALLQFADEGRRFASATVDPAMAHSGLPMLEDFGFTPAGRTIVYALDL
ncbi:MAG: GNAT family N-acetyltransferase [Bifidobacteriaceae bacterium]|jgi:GNAT superfamily N-acetyltransferase|nr:GNAT family N-acetyltransferase [Bifidobacteriaceae bacterium]